MRIRHTATALTAAALLALTACSSAETTDDDAKATKPSKATTSAPELTDEQRASIAADNGIPPTPNAANWAAYIKALDAIDPDIVHGKEDKAISRGINACSSIKRYPDDTAQQIKSTGQRFTSPTHPEGRDTATATKILDTAHKHICPDY